MRLEIPDLPYSTKDLEPWVSARTVEIHYGKHHAGYMKKLRKAIEGKAEADQDLLDLVRTAEGDLFNNAAQVWNHTFYWRSMKPGGGGPPPKGVAERIAGAFGSVSDFRQAFAEAANGEFGSGWAWLVMDENSKLAIVNSSDAENPIRNGRTPILTLDVWEHAYYLDYQNERNRYVEGFLDHLLNWDFVEENLAKHAVI